MSNLAIDVVDIKKRYRIGASAAGQRTLRETLSDGARARLPSARRLLRPVAARQATQEVMWALKGISFQVNRGEVVGVIGRNGAGKSTLLKILSRVTHPTSGYADVFGRVGSLLEVGTGFHPELTGRENVYLSGAILGMTRAEMDAKFDEIIEFAEIARFVDTPVKRYSSGMYLRLAFSVAAHLEPEILIVDEVLAVGDAAFQTRCLGRMNDVARSGRTVLLVSHNLASIQHLCNTTILLDAGQICAIGPPADIVARYLAQLQTCQEVSVADWSDRTTTGEARLVGLEVLDVSGAPATAVPFGAGVCFRLTAEFQEPLQDPAFGVIVHDATGQPILDIRSTHAGLSIGRAKGRVVVYGGVPGLALYPGRYLLSPWIMDCACRRDVDFVKLCGVLDIYPAPGPYGDLKLDPAWGKFWVPSKWDAGREAQSAECAGEGLPHDG